MKTVYVLSVSGGKDSTACICYMHENYPDAEKRYIFADTGNEHDDTYTYLDYLETKFDIKIHRLKADFSKQIANKRMFIARDRRVKKAKRKGKVIKIRYSNKLKRRILRYLHATGNPFIDLCMWKGRFPSRQAQFCTEQLKTNILKQYVTEIDADIIYSVQGIRRDESAKRRSAKCVEHLGDNVWAYRPLVDWCAQDVFDIHREFGVNPNPLYLRGSKRVGCYPCINSGKDDIFNISKRDPLHIDKIRKWEELVGETSKRGASSFFFSGKNDEWPNIDAKVAWSKTLRGGKHPDLIKINAPVEECASSYGLCDTGIWDFDELAPTDNSWIDDIL